MMTAIPLVNTNPLQICKYDLKADGWGGVMSLQMNPIDLLYAVDRDHSPEQFLYFLPAIQIDDSTYIWIVNMNCQSIIHYASLCDDNNIFHITLLETLALVRPGRRIDVDSLLLIRPRTV